MNNPFELEAQARTGLGTRESRRMRREGLLPAVMYGVGTQPASLTLKHSEVVRKLENEAFYSHVLTVKVDGQAHKAVLRDLQRHPYKPEVLHMDLQRIDPSKPVRMQVPVHFRGEETCPGVKVGGGKVSRLVSLVEVTCLAQELPEYLEADLSHLDIGQTAYVSDLEVPEGVKVTALASGGRGLPIATVVATRATRTGE
jgi:large subunit ribosomal protein L25